MYKIDFYFIILLYYRLIFGISRIYCLSNRSSSSADREEFVLIVLIFSCQILFSNFYGRVHGYNLVINPLQF